MASDTIFIWRDPGGVVRAEIHTIGSRPQPLPKVLRTSKAIFDYGEDNGGAVNLAMSIVHACCGRDPALEWYRQFASDQVVPRFGSVLAMPVRYVRHWIRLRQDLLRDRRGVRGESA